jgi:hypothetical protein
LCEIPAVPVFVEVRAHCFELIVCHSAHRRESVPHGKESDVYSPYNPLDGRRNDWNVKQKIEKYAEENEEFGAVDRGLGRLLPADALDDDLVDQHEGCQCEAERSLGYIHYPVAFFVGLVVPFCIIHIVVVKTFFLRRN